LWHRLIGERFCVGAQRLGMLRAFIGKAVCFGANLEAKAGPGRLEKIVHRGNCIVAAATANFQLQAASGL